MCLFIFFFKQKTAYEMRISDWSSDVCSSDLHRRVDVAVDRSLGGGGEIADLFGGVARLLNRAARVGERFFDRRAVAREDRGRLFDIIGDAEHARLVFVLEPFAEHFGYQQHPPPTSRSGGEDLATAGQEGTGL